MWLAPFSHDINYSNPRKQDPLHQCNCIDFKLHLFYHEYLNISLNTHEFFMNFKIGAYEEIYWEVDDETIERLFFPERVKKQKEIKATTEGKY
ncbi:CLUMA_CG004950, isoform A [Clunio marinus]|uniref:CLUMA_CG004950, isoform A n=1 Tax=Clunio marinus TaxID=568069 RepID=A0A1J1HT87_9DIPT|nr:CLUMA_CG004950, isoform A [Clunio marinus]